MSDDEKLLPEGRICINHAGILTPLGKRGPNDGLAVVEVDGEPVCHIPYTDARWEHSASGVPNWVILTFLSGRFQTSTRELKDV